MLPPLLHVTPGFILILHTFGRNLKWNPHIHCLISERGYSDNGFWRSVRHFNYKHLRNAFRTALLNEMEAKTAIKYIGRYLGRPVIASSRIDKYDGEFVTFHYNRHEDGAYVEKHSRLWSS